MQSFVQEDAERARYGGEVERLVAAALRRAKTRGMFFGVITLTSFGGIVVVLWQGGLMVLQGSITAGALVSFLLYTVFIAASVGSLASFLSSYQEAVGAARRVFVILQTTSPIRSPEAPVPLPEPVRGRVTIEALSFWYQEDPKQPWALQNVNLTLEEGEVVALVGPSGSGKTTLGNMLPGSGILARDGCCSMVWTSAGWIWPNSAGKSGSCRRSRPSSAGQ